MPRKSLAPKTKKPKETKQKRVKNQASSQKQIESEADYIDIYEKNPEVEKKIKLLWLIIIPAALLLIIFWFWLLKQNIGQANIGNSVTDVRDEISKRMAEIKENMSYGQIQTSTQSTTTDINEIKNQVIEQLQKNINPQNWPSHDSEVMGISIKYPPEWSQNEQNESITISAPSRHNATSSGTSTDSTYSRVLINRESVSVKTKLEDWLKKNAPDKDEYALKTPESSINIDGKKAIIYENINKIANDINQIIFVQKDKFIYQIQINVSGRKTSDESYINGIINTIKFLP